MVAQNLVSEPIFAVYTQPAGGEIALVALATTVSRMSCTILTWWTRIWIIRMDGASIGSGGLKKEYAIVDIGKGVDYETHAWTTYLSG